MLGNFVLYYSFVWGTAIVQKAQVKWMKKYAMGEFSG